MSSASIRSCILLAAGAAVLTLGACAVTPGQETERRVAADGTACPDVRRALPFPVTRPECWSDAEWEEYLALEAERSRNGDRYNEWSFF